jgi:hypothetical protein
LINTDLVNGLFEVAGVFFIIPSILQIRRDKSATGVSWWTQFFFLSWGCWNLFFYPHHGLSFSAIGAAAMVIAQIYWLHLIIRYRQQA